MSEAGEQETNESAHANRTVYVLALIFVAIGLINSTPVIPGWDDFWRGLTGFEKLKTRAFSTE